MRVGVDVGGTFTDLVALVDGELVTAKVPTVPADQSQGVAEALAAAAIEPSAVSVLAHGTTVATNALLERTGARTALVTTEGFRDLLEIGRQSRPSLYDLTLPRPEPLVPRPLRFTVRERMGPHGVLVPLDEESVAEAVRGLAAARVEAVAVCLLFGFAHPEHEERVAEAIAVVLPDVRVSLSSRVLPEFREYERAATTAADAYLSGRVEEYLRRLRARTPGRLLVMQSSGGVSPEPRAAACVLSGPAAGVVGAAFVAAASGFADVLTIDMGGTSTDVAAVVGGAVETTTESVVGGVPIKLPAVAVHTVGAGGGSIAWLDDGGALRVGPRSAGADPGPAAYGRGSVEPTVTDAHVVLGHLPDEIAGIRLRRELALRALERVGGDAEGVLAVANAEMARALRVISVERGLDPRDFALVAFGGAGPLHACALADELGMRTVLVPRASGVLSALGLAIADLRWDRVAPALTGSFEELGDGERLVDARYRGQSFELTVPADGWQERFEAEHERRYGFRMPGEAVELVNLRVVETAAGERPRLGGGAEAERTLEGPLTVELPQSTCLVAAGWSGSVDEAGTLVLRRR